MACDGQVLLSKRDRFNSVLIDCKKNQLRMREGKAVNFPGSSFKQYLDSSVTPWHVHLISIYIIQKVTLVSK